MLVSTDDDPFHLQSMRRLLEEKLPKRKPRRAFGPSVSSDSETDRGTNGCYSVDTLSFGELHTNSHSTPSIGIDYSYTRRWLYPCFSDSSDVRLSTAGRGNDCQFQYCTCLKLERFDCQMPLRDMVTMMSQRMKKKEGIS